MAIICIATVGTILPYTAINIMEWSSQCQNNVEVQKRVFGRDDYRRIKYIIAPLGRGKRLFISAYIYRNIDRSVDSFYCMRYTLATCGLELPSVFLKKIPRLTLGIPR